ncbi:MULTISPECIES: colicin immunity domain-containing protein [unclassified Duganella]|uniref:colicin immunity domain-containing protein n=1 Tax=unclassified Duganella TaxID=2636909 RepID=UPI000B8A0F81|nr:MULTISPECIES: colicin immunity domain-containing protein [unclassified Duganella]
MNTAFDRYSDLIKRFLSRQWSAQESSDQFLEAFKNETEPLGVVLFSLLDELFGDAESYTADEILLSKDPDFYLDKVGLEAKARDIMQRMKAWRRQQSEIRRAVKENSELPADFVGDALMSMAEPRDDAVPFVPRSAKRSEGSD